MPVKISIAKGTSNPTSSTGLTLGEPAFNYANNTLWMGKGSGNTPVWLGAGVCGASGGIAAGLTYQIPTLGAIKDYFSAVSSSFIGTTSPYISSFNGLTGAVQGVSAAVAGTGISVSGATGSVTITNIGVQSFNGLTGAVTGASLGANTFTALNSFNSGISSNGATLSGTVIAPTPAVGTNNTQVATTAFVQSEIVADTVTTFNGRTGAVQGVSSASAGTGISISAATGAITITNIGVQTFNGLTGAVTGVTVGGANIFTALNSFNSGISSAGGTFSALTRFNAGISSAGGTFSANTRFLSGIQTDSVFSTTGAGGSVYINSDSNGNGGNSITYIGDWDGANNNTSITVDDVNSLITLNSNVSTNSISTQTITASSSVVVGAAAATIDTATTTLGTTAANQTISSTTVYDGEASLDVNRTIEFLVQASTSSAYEALKIIAIHDGTNTYNTQYGLIRSGSSLCSSYTTTIATVGSGSKVLRLRATPTNTNTTFKVVEIIIPA